MQKGTLRTRTPDTGPLNKKGRIAVILANLLLASACTTSPLDFSQDKPSPTDATYTTVMLSERAADLAGQIMGVESAEEARKFVSEEAVIGGDYLLKLIDYNIALIAIDRAILSPEEAREFAGNIVDISIKQEALRAIDYWVANEALDAVSYDFEKGVSLIAKIRDSSIREETTESFYINVENELLDMSEYDPERAILEIEKVRADKLRGDVIAIVSARLAEDITWQVVNGYIEPEEARVKLVSITNPHIMGEAIKCLTSGVVYPNGLASNATATKISKQNPGNPIGKKYDDAKEKLRLGAENSGNSADTELSVWVADENGLHTMVDSSLVLSSLLDPGTTLNLGGVNSTNELPDIENIVVSSEIITKQFAEVMVIDGELNIIFEQDNGLDETTKENISRVIKAYKPLIEVAFASGNLFTIRFNVGDDYDPSYMPDYRTINITVPKSNKVSMDQLGSSLVHELVHVLTRQTFDQNNNDLAEERLVIKTCSTIKDVIFKSIENDKAIFEMQISDVINNVDAEYKEIFKRLNELIQNEDLFEEFDQIMPNATYNNCSPDDLNSVIQKLALGLGINTGETKFEDDLILIRKLQSYMLLETYWNQLNINHRIYKLLSESSYIESEEESTPYLGHPHDKASELVASTLTISILYTQQLIDGINKLKGDDKKAALKAVSMSSELATNNKGLKAYLDIIKKRIIKATK